VDGVIAVFILVVLFAFAGSFFRGRRQRRRNVVGRYKLIDYVLTNRERDFYDVLAPLAAKHGLHVLVKPRIADFVNVKAKQSDKGSGFHYDLNFISQKHIDFLLCNKQFAPVAGFEVQDSTHNRADRQLRDTLVSDMYKDIGLYLAEVWEWRNPADIEEHILLALNPPEVQTEKRKPSFWRMLFGLE
jgi:hypothetical protein